MAQRPVVRRSPRRPDVTVRVGGAGAGPRRVGRGGGGHMMGISLNSIRLNRFIRMYMSGTFGAYVIYSHSRYDVVRRRRGGGRRAARPAAPPRRGYNNRAQCRIEITNVVLNV